eukprot:CFRG1983T1
MTAQSIKSEVDIDTKLRAALLDMNVPEAAIKDMLKRSNSDKLKMLNNHQRAQESEEVGQSHSAESMISRLTAASAISKSAGNTDELLKILQVLRIALATGALTWLESFHRSNGLNTICTVIESEIQLYSNRLQSNALAGSGSSTSIRSSPTLQESVLCLTAYMDYKDGFRTVMKNHNGMVLLVKLVGIPDHKVVQSALELLSVISYARNGHAQVLRAFTKSAKKGENRFQSLVTYMDSSPAQGPLIAGLQTIIAVVSIPYEVRFRVQLEDEFSLAGLTQVLKDIKGQPGQSDEIISYVEMYETKSSTDYAEYLERAELVLTLPSNGKETFGVLDTISNTHHGHHYFYMSILQQMTLILAQCDNNKEHYFRILQRMLRHVVLPVENLIPKFNSFHLDCKLLLRHDDIPKPGALELANKKMDDCRAKIDSEKESRDAMKLELAESMDALEKERKTSLSVLEAMQKESSIEQRKLNETTRKTQEELRAHRQNKEGLETLANMLQRAIEGKINVSSIPTQINALPHPSVMSSVPPPPPAPITSSIIPNASPPAPPPPPGGGPPPPPPPPAGGPPPPPGGPPPPPPPPGGPPAPSPPPPPGGPPGPPPPPGGPPGPPPPPGGPPGPPPPPGGHRGPPGMLMTATPKQNYETKNQFKRVNWAKIPAMKVGKSFWANVNEARYLNKLDIDDFESAFAIKKAAPKDLEKIAAEEEKNAKKTLLQSCLDGKKQYNISIMLGRLKTDFVTLRKAFLRMDDTCVPLQMMVNIQKYLPDPEELAQLKSPPCPVAELSPADQFVYELNINTFRFPQRLETMLFTLSFKEKLEYCRKEIDAVRLAAVELKTSKHFKKLLEIVLLVGNYMNASVTKGQPISGFQIEFINKLVNTKTGDNKSTLLHHIVRVVRDKSPETSSFQLQIASVTNARRVQLQSLQTDLAEIRVGISKIKQELEVKREIVDGDKYMQVASSFYETAQLQFDTLTENFERMNRSFLDTVAYFGMDAKKASPDDFFEIFDTFLEMYKNVEVELKAADEKKAKEEKRQRDKEAKMKTDEEKKRKAAEALKAKQTSTYASHSVTGVPNVTLDDDDSEKMDINSLVNTLRGGRKPQIKSTRATRNAPTEDFDSKQNSKISHHSSTSLETGEARPIRKGKVGGGTERGSQKEQNDMEEAIIGQDTLNSVTAPRKEANKGIKLSQEEIDNQTLVQVIAILKEGRLLTREMIIESDGVKDTAVDNVTATEVPKIETTGRRAGRRTKEKSETSAAAEMLRRAT